MTITATVIADSISPDGIRLTTFQLRYPRFIHAELMTHRVFSRNASSSRAIPVKRIIEDIQNDPAIPIHWGKNIPGMQAHEQIDEPVSIAMHDRDGDYEQGVSKEFAWLAARDRVIEIAQAFDNAGYHKQIVNRLLEPWSHINVLVTATEYANWFHLRSHADAQPEIKELSDKMFVARRLSAPSKLVAGQWHLPYITPKDIVQINAYIKYNRTPNRDAMHNELMDLAIKVSVARCARVSYLTHGGRPTLLEEDLKLYGRLLGSQPLHASPAEHQASPDQLVKVDEITGDNLWANPDRHGNFNGWIQYRKTLPYEYVAG